MLRINRRLASIAIALALVTTASTLVAKETKRTVDVESTSTIGWVGAKLTGDHTGGFESFEGRVELDARGRIEGLSFEVDTTSIFSDNDMLTGHLKSADFFDVETYPSATFVSTDVKKGLDRAFAKDPTAKGATHTITGKLTIRGITKTIKFPAKIQKTRKSVTASTEFSINRTSFGLVYKGKPDDLIRELVVLKIKLDAPRS